MLEKLFQSNTLINIFFILTGFLVIQFFIITPRKKEQEQRNNFLTTLKPGMHITTIGGIHGNILKVDHTTVLLQTDTKGNSLLINKQAINQENKKPNQQPKHNKT